MAGAPLSPQQAAGNGTAARPRTVLSSAAEFKSLLRSGGPVLALFVQRRCPLSRLFWPTFVAASERFPHVRFVAVDVEFEYSLNAQLGIGAVPHVIFATALGSGSRPGQLHVRAFPVGLDLSSAEQRLLAFVQLHSGQLPTEADPWRPPPAAADAASPFQSLWAPWEPGRRQDRAQPAEPLLGRARSRGGADADGPAAELASAELEAFPEPDAFHWQLVASILVLAGWVLQIVAGLAARCAPRFLGVARSRLAALVRQRR